MALGLWEYNSELIPLTPPLLPWNFTIMPVTSMLFYQYKPQINPLIKSVVFSAIGSFIGQPMFAYIGVYNPKHWKHYYSFPILVIIYLIGHYFLTRKNFKEV